MFNPWAGEIVLNYNKVFTADGANGTYQLDTVVLQEVGHALGINNKMARPLGTAPPPSVTTPPPNTIVPDTIAGVDPGIIFGEIWYADPIISAIW